jgi:hypothetical protein
MPSATESTPVGTRVRPTLPPLAYTALIGIGLMLVAMVVGIAMLVVILKDSRDHIRAQDRKTAVLLEKLRAAQPTAQQVPALLAQARPAVRNLARSVGPALHAIDSTAAATERLPVLVRVTEALAQAGFPVLSELRAADLGRQLQATTRATQEAPPLIRRLLDLQATTLNIQRRSLRVQLTTLDVQRQALKHIESIDRKTGGTVPAQGVPVPAP